MKKNSFFCILLILCSLGLYSSCSNDDIKTEEQPNQSSLAEQLNKSKLTTIEHNIMLDNFYNLLKKNPISVNRNILNDENALDSCIMHKPFYYSQQGNQS